MVTAQPADATNTARLNRGDIQGLLQALANELPPGKRVDLVLIGSAAMVLMGLRETAGDLDVFYDSLGSHEALHDKRNLRRDMIRYQRALLKPACRRATLRYKAISGKKNLAADAINEKGNDLYLQPDILCYDPQYSFEVKSVRGAVLNVVVPNAETLIATKLKQMRNKEHADITTLLQHIGIDGSDKEAVRDKLVDIVVQHYRPNRTVRGPRHYMACRYEGAEMDMNAISYPPRNRREALVAEIVGLG